MPLQRARSAPPESCHPRATAGRELTIGDLRFDPPRFSAARMAELSVSLFGIEGRIEPLEGERDQNARITTADGRRYVLKISSAREDPQVVEFQVCALQHIARQDPGLTVPRLVPGRDGSVRYTAESGSGTHAVRLLEFLPGIPYQDGPFPSPAGLRGVGHFVARLGRALRGFSHPAAGHFMPWDLANGLVLSEQMRGLLPRSARELLAGPLERVRTEVYPRLAALRAQVIHQDAHGANLLRPSADDEAVAGVIDFGDMIHGPLICDLAACASHFIEEGADPPAITAELCRGYHAVEPLHAEELGLLPDLVMIRQIMTVQLFEFRRRNMERPPAFVTDDQPGLIASLRRLAALDRAAFVRRLEEVCS